LISFCSRKRNTRFLEQTAALARDDVDQRSLVLVLHGSGDDSTEGSIDVVTSVVEVVQVQLEFQWVFLGREGKVKTQRQSGFVQIRCRCSSGGQSSPWLPQSSSN